MKQPGADCPGLLRERENRTQLLLGVEGLYLAPRRFFSGNVTLAGAVGVDDTRAAGCIKQVVRAVNDFDLT